MASGRRWALLAVVVAGAVAAFVIAQPGEDRKSKKKATASTRTTPAGTPTATKPAARVAPVFIQIEVRGGKPVGGVKKITVRRGERVRFEVSSDVADEVHVHGYDFMKDVEADGKARFDFPAKISGGFEVELEHRQEQIAELKVQP